MQTLKNLKVTVADGAVHAESDMLDRKWALTRNADDSKITAALDSTGKLLTIQVPVLPDEGKKEIPVTQNQVQELPEVGVLRF